MVKHVKENPLISIILPVYNADTFLKTSVENLLSQQYRHIEIIAIDDYSRDKSFNILQELAKYDKRLKISKNVKRYGMAITLNRALKKTRGKFITFVNAENMYADKKIFAQLDFLLKHEGVVGVGTQCIFLDRDNNQTAKSDFPLESIEIYKKPLDGVTLQFETLMINKYRIPKDVLYFHTNKHPFLYSDLYMKLLQYGELVNLPRFLSFHRQQETSTSGNKRHIPSIIRLWLRAETLLDYRPSFKSLFFSFLKPRVTS